MKKYCINIFRLPLRSPAFLPRSPQAISPLFHAANAGTAAGITSFDLVILGMGDDGHTLSLFPGTKVVHEEQAWVKAFFLEAQDMYRITLTKTIVNRAARVAFLTTGKAKAHALKEVLQGAYNPDLYPSQEIKPQGGELHWFVDTPPPRRSRGIGLRSSRFLLPYTTIES